MEQPAPTVLGRWVVETNTDGTMSAVERHWSSERAVKTVRGVDKDGDICFAGEPPHDGSFRIYIPAEVLAEVLRRTGYTVEKTERTV